MVYLRNEGDCHLLIQHAWAHFVEDVRLHHVVTVDHHDDILLRDLIKSSNTGEDLLKHNVVEVCTFAVKLTRLLDAISDIEHIGVACSHINKWFKTAAASAVCQRFFGVIPLPVSLLAHDSFERSCEPCSGVSPCNLTHVQDGCEYTALQRNKLMQLVATYVSHGNQREQQTSATAKCQLLVPGESFIWNSNS
jgi:hypothetical protein